MNDPGSAPDDARQTGLSNLQLRILSAIVLIVVVLAAAWAGGIWFSLLAIAIGAAVLYEWLTMTTALSTRTMRLELAITYGVVAVLLLAGLSHVALIAATIPGALMVLIHAGFARTTLWPVGGLVYAALSAVALSQLRGHDTAGLHALLFLFAIVWATDIMAYFVGRALGGPKLAPSISPGKTWSGALGGAIFAAVAGLAIALYFESPMSFAAVVIASLVLSTVSQAGDLFESSIKRRFGFKDSGHLIPGHGGVMDRVDGLVAAAAAMFAWGVLVMGTGAVAHAFFAN